MSVHPAQLAYFYSAPLAWNCTALDTLADFFYVLSIAFDKDIFWTYSTCRGDRLSLTRYKEKVTDPSPPTLLKKIMQE